MNDFQQRLQSAINRGKQRAEQQTEEHRRDELTEEQLRQRHGEIRLTLCDQIETAVHGVADHFPGFRVEAIYDGEIGWGTACFRNDLRVKDGKRTTVFSRYEIVVRPFSDLRVFDVKAKGTVHNRELIRRSHFVPVAEAELGQFSRLVESWTLEYAEVFAARG